MTKKGQKQKTTKEPVKEDTIVEAVDAYDEEVNSGFASYLRSTTGIWHVIKYALNLRDCLILGQETLKLFVVVNSLVMFLTVAWPQMKNVYDIMAEFISENFGSVELL